MNKLNPPDYNSECIIRKSPPTKQATQSDLDTQTTYKIYP